MVQRGGAGWAHAPPDFDRSEGAAGSGGAPHYYVPPQIFRLWTMPAKSTLEKKIMTENDEPDRHSDTSPNVAETRL